MNYIRHLTGFYEKIQQDNRLNPTHISLYLALFQFWNLNHFHNPISISRNEMMKLSKISAFGTYHKCIKELQEFGYIEYLPSFNPYKGSLVNLFNFDTSTNQKPISNHTKKQTSSKQALDHNNTNSETGSVQALEPSINYKNLLNSKLVFVSKTTNTNSEYQINNSVYSTFNKPLKESLKEKEKLRQKKNPVFTPLSIPPKLDEVFLFFEEKEAPKSEAQKFYNHYESNGWLVGGKSKMKNWQAAARNWLLNYSKFNNREVPPTNQNYLSNHNHLTATTNKNYSEPL